ncbi:MAG: hypothetical protein ACLRFI_02990 [Alphaproteobacteria bacterium]
MSRQIQIRRGTTVENNNFTGAEGEITVDTTTKQLRIHDGTTPGGFIVGRESYSKTETDNQFTNKSNINLSNITATGKEVIAHLAMPSNRYVNLTLGASGTSYTTPADGYVYLRLNLNTNGGFVYIQNDSAMSIFHRHYSTSNWEQRVWLPVRKGGTYVVSYSGKVAAETDLFRFAYAQGAQ